MRKNGRRKNEESRKRRMIKGERKQNLNQDQSNSKKIETEEEEVRSLHERAFSCPK
jgi:hypothetical protein